MGAPTNIWYSNIALAAQGGVNVLAALSDPNLTFSRVKLVTAVYTMTGNEVANDVIYIARMPSGAIVDVTNGYITGNGIATTATVSVGDTDTQGGTVAYDPARYSTALNVAANLTTAVGFTGGTTLNAPPQNPIATAALAGMTGFSGVSSSQASVVSWGTTDDWCWLLATFATLTVPVVGKVLVFRIQVSSLD